MGKTMKLATVNSDLHAAIEQVCKDNDRLYTLDDDDQREYLTATDAHRLVDANDGHLIRVETGT